MKILVRQDESPWRWYFRVVLSNAVTRPEAAAPPAARAETAPTNGSRRFALLFVHYPPKLTISTLVNRLKGVSAHCLRKEFTGRINRHLIHGHLWSPSYFAASCDGAPLAIVKEYITNQKRPG